MELPIKSISASCQVRRLTEEDLPELLALAKDNPTYYRYMGEEPTLEGLRVGLTVEEAEALGYPLSQCRGFGGGLTGNMLCVAVENGVVTGLDGTFGMGRYIGKFWEQ